MVSPQFNFFACSFLAIFFYLSFWRRQRERLNHIFLLILKKHNKKYTERKQVCVFFSSSSLDFVIKIQFHFFIFFLMSSSALLQHVRNFSYNSIIFHNFLLIILKIHGGTMDEKVAQPVGAQWLCSDWNSSITGPGPKQAYSLG